MTLKRTSAPARKTPLKRGGRPKVNRQRKAANFARQYHSVERVEFVKSRPCDACRVVGYSENAHVGRRSGAGRKGPYTEIASLCGPRVIPPHFTFFAGCHWQFDNDKTSFYYDNPGFNPEHAARDTEAAWLASLPPLEASPK